MQQTENQNILSFLSAVSLDPDILGITLIDEIERCLPDVIVQLRIPPGATRQQTQIIENRLAGKPGFRRFSAGERNQIAEQLEDEAFLRSLRRVQESLSDGVEAGTAKHARVYVTDTPEATKVLPDTVPDTAPQGKARIIPKSSPTHDDSLIAPIPLGSSSTQQVELPFEISEAASVNSNQIDRGPTEGILEVSDLPIELHETLAGRDIRGLLALIKADRLVGFIEPTVGNLLPREVKRIHVPNTEMYKNLNLEDLITGFHELAASDDDHVRKGDSEFVLLDLLIAAIEHESQWARINVRRFHLINKKHVIGLHEQESEELRILDQLAQRQMYAAQPLPFAELATLRTFARRLGFEDPDV
jgi:hypothetical protein